MKTLVVILSFFVCISYSYAQPDSLELDDSGGINFFIGLSSSGQKLNSLNSEIREAEYPEIPMNNYLFTNFGYFLRIWGIDLGVNFGFEWADKEGSSAEKETNLESYTMGLILAYKIQATDFLRIYPIAGYDFDISKLRLIDKGHSGGSLKNSLGRIYTYENNCMAVFLGLGTEFLIHTSTKEKQYEMYKIHDITKNETKEYSSIYTIQRSYISIALEAKYMIGVGERWGYEGNSFDIPGLYPGRFSVGIKIGAEMFYERYEMPEEEEE